MYRYVIQNLTNLFLSSFNVIVPPLFLDISCKYEAMYTSIHKNNYTCSTLLIVTCLFRDRKKVNYSCVFLKLQNCNYDSISNKLLTVRLIFTNYQKKAQCR